MNAIVVSLWGVCCVLSAAPAWSPPMLPPRPATEIVLDHIERDYWQAGARAACADAIARDGLEKGVRECLDGYSYFASAEIAAENEERRSRPATPEISGEIETAARSRPETSEKLLGHQVIGVDHYVRVASFDWRHLTDEFRRLLGDLEAAGASRVVIDLRGNGGGLVHQAWELAALFAPKGTQLFAAYGRKPEYEERRIAAENGPFLEWKVVVLVDKDTASSAAMFAGIMQSLGHPVVGQTTFPKGVYQHPFALPDGGQLYLTIAEWKVGAGERSVQGVGVIPDVPCDSTEALAKAFEVLRVQ